MSLSLRCGLWHATSAELVRQHQDQRIALGLRQSREWPFYSSLPTAITAIGPGQTR